ncbi:hypothetical protein AOB60_15200 [Streptomyces noursei]|uniref:ABC transporter domain-containing protein n=1 Tax=Streptomyces noursei TaxID=1971 RepID=A0A2N8PLQ1_STRNR|nr:hypothetical protein AOB60_15200 [Streptomyces noursei]
MDSTPHGAAVTAAGFGVEGPRGRAFRDIDVTAEPGALIAVQGPSGSGRTCPLLALTGRMKPAAGTAEAGGLPMPPTDCAASAAPADTTGVVLVRTGRPEPDAIDAPEDGGHDEEGAADALAEAGRA